MVLQGFGWMASLEIPYGKFPTHKIFYFTFYIDIRHPLTFFTLTHPPNISKTAHSMIMMMISLSLSFSLWKVFIFFSVLYNFVVWREKRARKQFLMNQNGRQKSSPKAFVGCLPGSFLAHLAFFDGQQAVIYGREKGWDFLMGILKEFWVKF